MALRRLVAALAAVLFGLLAVAAAAAVAVPLNWSLPAEIDHQPPYDGNGNQPVFAISCPSISLCIAVDEWGNVLTSTNPTGGAGAWNVAPASAGTGPLEGVSCASTSLCVAVDNTGVVITSTDPTNPATWGARYFGGVG